MPFENRRAYAEISGPGGNITAEVISYTIPAPALRRFDVEQNFTTYATFGSTGPMTFSMDVRGVNPGLLNTLGKVSEIEVDEMTVEPDGTTGGNDLFNIQMGGILIDFSPGQFTIGTASNSEVPTTLNYAVRTLRIAAGSQVVFDFDAENDKVDANGASLYPEFGSAGP